MTDTPTLLTLPPELLDEIAIHLPYTSLLALRWTCYDLYATLASPLPARWLAHFTSSAPDALRRARDKRYPFKSTNGLIDLKTEAERRAEDEERRLVGTLVKKDRDSRRCMFDLLIVEAWPMYNTAATSRLTDEVIAKQGSVQDTMSGILPLDMYACHLCLRLLPQRHFALAQTRGDKTRGRYSAKALLERQEKIGYYVAGLAVEERYCLECGTRRGKYQKGCLLQFVEEEAVEVLGAGRKMGGGGSGENEGGGGEGNGRGPARKLVLGTGIVCKRCGEFKRVGSPETKAALRRLCEECLKYRPP